MNVTICVAKVVSQGCGKIEERELRLEVIGIEGLKPLESVRLDAPS